MCVCKHVCVFELGLCWAGCTGKILGIHGIHKAKQLNQLGKQTGGSFKLLLSVPPNTSPLSGCALGSLFLLLSLEAERLAGWLNTARCLLYQVP